MLVARYSVDRRSLLSSVHTRTVSGPCRRHLCPKLSPHPTCLIAPPLKATILPGGSNDTQCFVIGDAKIEVPISGVQRLPEAAQAAVFASLMASVGLATFIFCTNTDLGWTQSPASPYILGLVFTAGGAAHFGAHEDYCSMMPTKGAWGIWYLPGSDSFHVNWTGVAEIAGGLGLLATNIPAVSNALPSLVNASALGLLALTIAVTPANIFMATHNAPGPGPKGQTIAPSGHIFRGLMQIFLCAALWGLAQSS